MLAELKVDVIEGRRPHNPTGTLIWRLLTFRSLNKECIAVAAALRSRIELFSRDCAATARTGKRNLRCFGERHCLPSGLNAPPVTMP
jgi:hypothetical protein